MELKLELSNTSGTLTGSFGVSIHSPNDVKQTVVALIAQHLDLKSDPPPETDTRITLVDPEAVPKALGNVNVVMALNSKIAQMRALAHRLRERREWEQKNTQTLDGRSRALSEFARWLVVSESEMIMWITNNCVVGAAGYTLLDYNKQLQAVEYFASDRYIDEMIRLIDKQ